MTRTTEPPSARSGPAAQTIRVKPSFLEAGLPCAALSAESQRDNNSLRPPQNRLHIWWARRAPTVSRAAILAGLLPYDLRLNPATLPIAVSEPTSADLSALPPRLRNKSEFIAQLLNEVRSADLPENIHEFLLSLGILGDADAAYRRIQAAGAADQGTRVVLGSQWGYRHDRAFAITPSPELIGEIHSSIRTSMGLAADEEIVVADTMAGGGSIPLEAIRYGFRAYANDLNPVATVILKATLEYPSRHGAGLAARILEYSKSIARCSQE